jgi:hypothetical protein
MKIMEFFDRAYAVNLPERKDRRSMIVRELDKAGMPLTPNKTEIFSAIRPDDSGGFPSIGARGCFLSHLTILKRAREERLANVLIVEDDLTISEQFRTEQEVLVERLRRTDWDFVYFGHQEKTEETSPGTLQPFFGPLQMTHFYGVNGKTFDRLISFLDELQQRPGGHPDGGPMHLDGAYSTFRAQNPDIVTLIASPNLGWQRSSASDIHTAWFDRVPVLKELVGAARAAKGQLKP